MEKKYLITKNITYNFLGQIILFLLGIFTTPYIIHNLGSNFYGILSLVTVIIGYFSILDLGLGASVIKYISQYQAKMDKENLRKVINTALFAYIIIGLLGSLSIIIFTKFFLGKILHIPSEILPTALTVFYISSLGFFINMVLTVFNSIPSALQRMDITNSRNVIFGFINTFGVVLLLAFGQGIISVVIWNVLVSAAATIIFLSVILKLLPKISIRPGFDKEFFLILMRFGFFKFFSNISGQVVFQLDKLLIGIYYPISLVTFYAVPSVIVQKGLTIILNISNAVFPAMNASSSLNDNIRVRELYLRMTKFVVFLIFPLSAILFIYAESILLFWVGPEFAEKSSNVLKILALAYFVAALSAPGVVAADAFGKPQISAFFAGVSALINFIAAIIFIPRFGIEGAALALLVNFLAQVPFFLIVIHLKVVRISNWEVLRYAILKPVFAGLAASLVVMQIHNIFIGVVIFGLIYLILNIAIGAIDDKDKMTGIFLLGKINASFKRS